MKRTIIWILLIALALPCPVLAQDDAISCKQGDTFEAVFALTPDSECPDGIMGQLEYDNEIFMPVSPDITMRRNKDGSMNAVAFMHGKAITVSFQVNRYAPDGLYTIAIKVLEAAYADGRKTDQVKITPVQVRIGSAPTQPPTPTKTPTPVPKSTLTSTTTHVEESSITVGSYITFGHYPQTASGTDNTPIEWLVLDIDEASNKAALISRYSLNSKPYNSTEKNVTWETCTLRSWLNLDFLNAAFSTEEQKAILLTNVDNSKNTNYWKGGNGSDTKDKVFLLSYTEAWNYFSDSNTRRCEPTEYAVKCGASAVVYHILGKSGGWWLRSSNNSGKATSISGTGEHQESTVNSAHLAVRPVICVDLGIISFLTRTIKEASPKPTTTSTVSPISITEVSYKGGGTVEISWEGGAERTWAYVYHWFNEQHNKDVIKCLVNDSPWVSGSNKHSNTVYFNQGTINGLVPGQRYWIVLTDSYENSTGNATWVDFEVPKGSKPDLSISMNKVYFYTNTDDSSWKIADNVTAVRIEKTCKNSPKYNEKIKHLWLTPTYTISNLSKEKTFRFLYVLILPNGDVFTNGGIDVTVKNGTWHYQHGFNVSDQCSTSDALNDFCISWVQGNKSSTTA